MPGYCILSIQTWIFGMKYIKSAIYSAPSNFCCSIKRVATVEWIFITLYIALVIWLSINLEILFDYHEYYFLYFTWISWIDISTLVTFYGIWKLTKVIKELKLKNPLLKFNNY